MERVEYQVMAEVEDRHWWYGGMRAIAASLLDPAFADQRDLSILDAGCGTGGNLLFLQRYGTAYGIDLAPEALELAQARTPQGLSRASVVDLPFANASFDLVTSFDVLYHRAVADEKVALREAARVLRPGGYLLIRLPAYEFLRSQHDQAVHTARRYTARSAAELLHASGFVVERQSYINTLLFPLPLTLRLLERLRPTPAAQTSALTMPGNVLNEALRWPLAAEAALLANGGAFPFGLSVLCLAQVR